MKTIDSLDQVSLSACACAIGQFDGVHLGHRMVLSSALRQSQILKLPSVVLTFANHPQSVISKTPTQLLSTPQERLEQFERMGFDWAIMLPFTETFQQLSAEAFINDILVAKLGVKSVSIGYDHRFGLNRQGDGAFLKAQGQQLGFEVHTIEPVSHDHQIISSTVIRKLLAYGDIRQANDLLGRPYTLTGTVIEGVGRGRQIGVPTANLQLPPDRLVPGQGVYAGWVRLHGQPDKVPAVCNIGVSPTFGDQLHPRMEVHLLDWSGDLYSQPLTFEFVSTLRPEQTFSSKEALVAQIHQDIATAKTMLGALRETSAP